MGEMENSWVENKSIVNADDGGEYSQFNQLPDDKILDWSKLKQIAGDILKCI